MKQQWVNAQSICPKQRKDGAWSRTLGGGQLLKISVVPKISGDGMPSDPSDITHSPGFGVPQLLASLGRKGASCDGLHFITARGNSC